MEVEDNITIETQHELNVRYADALLPLTILYGIFTVFGIIGNLFVLLVFSCGKPYSFKQTNFRVFVICMSVIDFVTCLFLIPSEIIKHRHHFAFESLFMCKAKCFLNLWAGISGALLLLIICIDRYLKVVLTFRRQISTKLAVRLCIMFTFVIPVIMSVPSAIMCGVQNKTKTNMYNTTTEISVCTTSTAYEDSIFKLIYKFTFAIMLVGVSLVCIIIYILIGRVIFKFWVTIPASFREESGVSHDGISSTDVFEHAKSLPERNIQTQDNACISKPSTQSDSLGKNIMINQSIVQQGSTKNRGTPKAGSLQSHYSIKSTSRKRVFRRQSSGFGMRRFPYKTLIWFVLTIVFVLTYMVCLGLSLYMPTSYNLEPNKLAIFSFFFRLYFINSIINPIVYAVLDKRFRESSKNLLGRCTRD